MYQFTLKHNKLILIVVCVLLLPFVGFSFYPIMNRITGGRALYKTIGTYELPTGTLHEVTYSEFESIHRRVTRTAANIRFLPVRNVDDVWRHILQVAEARLLGVRVSDEQLNEFVTNIRQKIGAEKVESYRKVVKSFFRLSLKEFEQTLREFLMRQELIRLYETTDNVSMKALLEKYQSENRRVTVRAVRFGVDDVRKTLKAIDFPLKPKLEAFYNDSGKRHLLTARKDLMLPRVYEQVDVVYGRYAKFDAEAAAVKALLKGYQPAADEVQQEYERWKRSLYKAEPEAARKKPEEPPAGAKKAGAPPAGGKKPGESEPGPKAAKEPPAGAKKADEPQAGEPKPPAPAAEAFKKLETVKDDVVRRLKLRKVLELVRAEAERRLEKARSEARAREEKAAAGKKGAKKGARKGGARAPGGGEQNPGPPGEKQNKDETPANNGDETRPVVPVDLLGLAKKYGLEFLSIHAKTFEELKQQPPFAGEVADVFAYTIRGLTEGRLSEVDSGSEELAFFARLVKDRPARLKPLEEIEDGVREVAMDDAAREKARELADAFHQALEAKVMEELKPVLDKEIEAPLREEKEKEIAEENADRAKRGQKPLSKEELQKIDARFEDLRKSREGPRIEKAKNEKLGRYFEVVAREKKLQTRDFTFYMPNRGPRSRGYDFDRERRERERDPEEAFIRYEGGVASLRKVGDVGRPVVDEQGKAAYVLKLVHTEPPRWENLDPRTYRHLLEEEKKARDFVRGYGLGRLGAKRLEKRYRLQTAYRYKPEKEEAERQPLLPGKAPAPRPPSRPRPGPRKTEGAPGSRG